MKKLLILAAVLLAPSLLAQKEVTIWHAYRGDEKAAFEKVVANYNASKKGAIKATTLAVPYDAFADKITAAVPRGKGPDVFIYAQDRLGGWVEAGNTIEPIDFYIDKATQARFIGSTMQAMTYRKTVYGLPLNYKVLTMIYNKKLVTKPPATTGELVAMAKKLSDPKTGRFGLAYWYSNYYYHAPLANGFGGAVFSPNNTPSLNAAGNVQSLNLLLKWMDKDKILPAEPSTALVTSLFNEGKAAIVFNGPWFLGEISDKVQYGLALLPKIDEAGGKPMRPWMTVEGVYIAAPSKNKDAAYDFVSYLTDTPSAKILALQGRQTPANLKVYQDPQIQADPVMKAFYNQVQVAVPLPNVPEMTMMWSPVTTAMNEIVQKASTPQASMNKAQKALVESVAKLKK